MFSDDWYCDDVCFFVFKQKTAYELRISDWSSYVCSSDLPEAPPPPPIDGDGEDRDAVNDLIEALDDPILVLAGNHVVRANTAARALLGAHEIGRASCRERVCQYVYISVVVVVLKKTKTK